MVEVTTNGMRVTVSRILFDNMCVRRPSVHEAEHWAFIQSSVTGPLYSIWISLRCWVCHSGQRASCSSFRTGHDCRRRLPACLLSLERGNDGFDAGGCEKAQQVHSTVGKVDEYVASCLGLPCCSI